MKDQDVPSMEFVNRLEWEIETAMRRPVRLNGSSSVMQLARGRWAGVLALVVVSMFVGGAGTYAAMSHVDSEVAALYIARGQILLDIARTRLEPSARKLARIEDLVKRGAAPQSVLLAAQADVQQSQTEVAVRELELAETQVTGQPPNDALSAPRVDGRDFVTERLVARRRALQMRLEMATAELERSQELSGSGLAPADALRAAQHGVSGVEGELSALQKRIALRASFLNGELSAAEVELQGMRASAVAAREAAARQLDDVAAQQERMKRLAEQGIVSPTEVGSAEADLQTIQGQVELANLELRILDEKLAQVRGQRTPD